MLRAILLIAHGSRRAEANADLEELAQRVRERCPEQIVEIAYLELAAPSIPEGLAACRARGAAEIRMLPYFLSAGAHVTSDLARYRDQFRSIHPDTECVLCPPLGLHPGVVEAVMDRLNQTT